MRWISDRIRRGGARVPPPDLGSQCYNAPIGIRILAVNSQSTVCIFVCLNIYINIYLFEGVNLEYDLYTNPGFWYITTYDVYTWYNWVQVYINEPCRKKIKDPRGVMRSSFPTNRTPGTTASATADRQDVFCNVDGAQLV